jgi:hypothetical protein
VKPAPFRPHPQLTVEDATVVLAVEEVVER